MYVWVPSYKFQWSVFIESNALCSLIGLQLKYFEIFSQESTYFQNTQLNNVVFFMNYECRDVNSAVFLVLFRGGNPYYQVGCVCFDNNVTSVLGMLYWWILDIYYYTISIIYITQMYTNLLFIDKYSLKEGYLWIWLCIS